MTRIVRTTARSLVLRTRPQATPNTDTQKRFLHEQTATALGESFDGEWLFIDAPMGAGWASKQFLVDAPVAAPVPSSAFVIPAGWPKVPHGRDQIIQTFGPPCEDVCEQGRVTIPHALPLSWAPQQLVTRFACHVLMVPVFASVFAEIDARGHWHLLEDFGGCFNCREQRGSNAKSSTHSWGIGIDINAKSNPLGAVPTMPQAIIDVFREHGFTYGGTWSRPDGMHFQYATGY